MAVPFAYNARNLLVRRVSTGLTVLGIALVVTVFLVLAALAEGLRRTFQTTASPRNVIVLRAGADSELVSMVDRAQLDAIRALPEVERRADGEPLASPEVVLAVNAVRRDGRTSNVVVRGVEPVAFSLRPVLRLVGGRRFEPGTNEVMVSDSLRTRFTGMDVGDELRSGSARWLVVGVFEAAGSPYDSEIWADLHDLQAQTRRHGVFSVVRLRVARAGGARAVDAAVRADQRVRLEAKSEARYYAEQMITARPIQFFAGLIGLIMAVGASCGAMNTMYAQVAARGREVGTLRAIGFSRREILAAFVVESVTLGALGGAIGVGVATLLVTEFLSAPTGTYNFTTLAEVLFQFELSAGVVGAGFVLALGIGALGGFLPAVRAARLGIPAALREP